MITENIKPGIFRFRSKDGRDLTRRVIYADQKKVTVELVEEGKIIDVPPDTWRRACRLFGTVVVGVDESVAYGQDCRSGKCDF